MTFHAVELRMAFRRLGHLYVDPSLGRPLVDQRLFGLYQTGLYQSLYQLGYYPASLLSQFLLQIATPIFFAKAGHGEAERWNRRLVLGAIGATLSAGAVSAAGGHKLLAFCWRPVIARNRRC